MKPMSKDVPVIAIDIATQTLTLRDGRGEIRMQTLVSTAKNGAGERKGSERTPRGRHIIRAKIG